jgi:hypothetical protein
MNAEKYAQRTLPLLVAPDLEGRSPAMFNQKGIAIEASAVMTSDYVKRFINASEALIGRAAARSEGPGRSLTGTRRVRRSRGARELGMTRHQIRRPFTAHSPTTH